MGGPASSVTAEVCKLAHDKTARSTALHPPKVCAQIVHDVYSILKSMNLEHFFNQINNLH